MDLSGFSAPDRVRIEAAMIEASKTGKDVDVILSDGDPFTVTPGPVEWCDSAAWLIDWKRGMYCIERPAGCQAVFHSVEEEIAHMDFIHPEGSAGIRPWEFPG